MQEAGPREMKLLRMESWPYLSGHLRKVWALTFPPGAGRLHLALGHGPVEEVNA